jgi:RHS repeat-associated protein
VDPANPTGYIQVVEEGMDSGTTPNRRLDPSEITKAFVLGMDVLTQATASSIYHLLYDAHGTTKAIVSAATSSVVERYVYSAYGIDLGLTATPATAFRYAGQFIDRSSGLSLSEKRWYDRAVGRWTRTDPWTGNTFQPLGYHEYGYVHGNPIMGNDPSGLFFNYVGMMAANGIRNVLDRLHVAPVLGALDRATTFFDMVQLITQFIATGTVDPSLVAGLLSEAIPFAGLFKKAKLVANRLRGVTNELSATFARVRRAPNISPTKAAQVVGDLGAITVAKKMGFRPTDFPVRYHGIDGVMTNGNRLVIIEAKGGGTGALGETKFGEQLSQDWIKRKIAILRDHNDHHWADMLDEARQAGDLDVLYVHSPIDGDEVLDPLFEVRDYYSLGQKTFIP